MATSFPSSLDTFTNPTSADALDSVSVPHATQHSDLNDAVEALEAKVGADSSAVTSSHDYKIAQLEARNLAGLVPISTTSVGTAVSSVTINDCFSADYDEYLVRWSGGFGSADVDMQLRVGGATTNYSYAYHFTYYTTGSSGSSNGTAQSKVRFLGRANTAFGYVEAIVRGPFLAQQTLFWSPASTAAGSGYAGGIQTDSTSFTSVTVLPNSGTITGGTITVYGCAKV